MIKKIVRDIKEAFLHTLFPHLCCGCGTDMLNSESTLCISCLAALPHTDFERYPDNPVEKLFWGRLPLKAATAQFYFTKESVIQNIIHRFKYKGHKEAGLQLGRMMGLRLLKSGRFDVDALIPLPLYPPKERKRGYNQSAVLCEGISSVMNVPVLNDVVSRPYFTETQTRKGRIERWKNIEGKFSLNCASQIHGKKILLVDDVVTTGATLEACGAELLKAQPKELFIAACCYAFR
ncbi:MAG: phosphoribosyltransferase family protein [Chitinophagaceae bacterium]|nr:phosphoribosyltransferase family protein [Chitinophagaceae bacterium]